MQKRTSRYELRVERKERTNLEEEEEEDDCWI